MKKIIIYTKMEYDTSEYANRLRKEEDE